MIPCPHCRTAHHDLDSENEVLANNEAGRWEITWHVCPACMRPVVTLDIESLRAAPEFDGERHGAQAARNLQAKRALLTLPHVTHNEHLQLYPRASSLPPAPQEVPAYLREDYAEACLVLAESPKASAALSRRCLQNLLKEKAKVTKRDLAEQIDEVLQSNTLPSHLAQEIDAIRNVGNFAAHPVKSTNTGTVVPVEPGEAEWLLEVLDGLFDFYFVQPASSATRRAALNQKLADAGKPPMK